MSKLQTEKFVGIFSFGPADFLQRLDRMFGRIFDRSEYIPFVVRDFRDASAAAVTVSLPNGVTNPDKDYYIVKTDASANAVTIAAFTSDSIQGAATITLAAQYDSAWLTYKNGVWYRIT